MLEVLEVMMRIVRDFRLLLCPFGHCGGHYGESEVAAAPLS